MDKTKTDDPYQGLSRDELIKELAKGKKELVDTLSFMHALSKADFGYIDYVDKDTHIPHWLIIMLDLRIFKLIV